MGKKALRGKVKHKPEKIAKALRARKVDIRGNIKRRRGDARHIWKDYSIKAKVLGQRKGGKVLPLNNCCRAEQKNTALQRRLFEAAPLFLSHYQVVADTNHRVCQLHKKCDCLLLTDMARMAPVCIARRRND